MWNHLLHTSALLHHFVIGMIGNCGSNHASFIQAPSDWTFSFAYISMHFHALSKVIVAIRFVIQCWAIFPSTYKITRRSSARMFTYVYRFRKTYKKMLSPCIQFFTQRIKYKDVWFCVTIFHSIRQLHEALWTETMRPHTFSRVLFMRYLIVKKKKEENKYCVEITRGWNILFMA